MRTILKWIGRALLALVILVALIGIWKREQVQRLLAVNSLFSEDRIVSNFSNMDTMFLTTRMSRGDAPISALPIGPAAPLPDDIQSWIDERAVTSLVVLHNGTLVHEAYYQGTTPEDLRISWSMAKSYLSALFGILIDEGAIGELSDPVTQYVPALIGSAYDGASLQDVLQMESGVLFDEDYLDFWSDINKMGRVLALGQSMDGFAAGLTERRSAPGEAWKYVSIDTHVIGMIARGATGRSATDLLQEKVIAPLRLEADPYYLTDGNGVAFVLGGLNLRTRDYARFGQMIANGGMWQGTRIVPQDWIEISTQPTALTEPGQMGYGYQWWMGPDFGPGEFIARGIYGQYIYINQPLNVVIATTGADRLFREPGVNAYNMDMLQRIAQGL